MANHVPGGPEGGASAPVRQVPKLECWLVTAPTLPDTEAQRRVVAPAYTAYLQGHLDRIALGAQVLDAPGGAVTERLYFVLGEDAQAARKLLEDSPYQQAGVYRVTEVRAATGMLGRLMGGVGWVPK